MSVFDGDPESWLWPHQKRGIALLRAAFRNTKRVLAVAPTGSGKSRMSVTMAALSQRKSKTILWIVHTTELVDQVVETFRSAGIHAGIIQADRKATPDALVQVATVQTLARREMPPCHLLIVDEAHLHVDTKYMNKILERLDPEAFVLGLSATPTLLNGKALGLVYRQMVQIAQPSELIAGGFLVEPRVFAPASPDVKGVPIKNGDYARDELSERCRQVTLVGSIPEHYAKICPDRSALLFAVDVAHSKACVEALRAAGVTAEHVDGETPYAERQGRIARFKRGEFRVLSNVEVLTTGFDYPELGCVILGRPTKSVALMIQMCGRVLRSASGKRDAIILDHAGNVLSLGFPHEDREWTLDGIPKRKESQVALRACPKCYAVMLPTVTTCHECGYVFQPAETEVVTAKGTLRELKLAAAEERKRVFQELCFQAIKYNAGREYVRREWKKRFGAALRDAAWPDALPIDMYQEREKLIHVARTKFGASRQWAEKWADKKLSKREV